MRFGLAAACWLIGACASAAAAPATPPYEIVKYHVDAEVAADGSYVESREEAYRVLNTQGIEALQERRLSYTQSFETLEIVSAYTRKADGTRIDVPKSGYLSGFGASSQPGFQDEHVTSVFFPNVEVGDQVVLITVHHQILPWFAGYFDMSSEFSRAIVTHDVRFAVTAPKTMKLKADALGMDAGAPQSEGGKKRLVWTFHNDAPEVMENDAVSNSDFAPHLRITSFASYADVARAYRDNAKERAAPTAAIRALADDLTKGVSDKRAQAKILYDWVSLHISYVAIVLGAGGFVPHEAQDVLSNKFGDCKDHVVLLEALLAAKGIDSTAVLIDAGSASYKLSEAASPHAFDHAITYIPAFNLYLDSTAQLAPFGVLPYSDVDKPVLKVASGEIATTPVPSSASSTIHVMTKVVVDADGTAEGNSKITAQGAYGIDMREYVQSVPAGKENDLLRSGLGPGVEGALDRGEPRDLREPYTFGVSYRVPNAVALPGPGALPGGLSFKPFYFTTLIAGTLPATRNSDYLCASLAADEDIEITLPAGMRLLSIPEPASLDASGVHLRMDYERADPRTLKESFAVRLDHPHQSCSAGYYASVHAALSKMTQTLRQQVIYKMQADK